MVRGQGRERTGFAAYLLEELREKAVTLRVAVNECAGAVQFVSQNRCDDFFLQVFCHLKFLESLAVITLRVAHHLLGFPFFSPSRNFTKRSPFQADSKFPAFGLVPFAFLFQFARFKINGTGPEVVFFRLHLVFDDQRFDIFVRYGAGALDAEAADQHGDQHLERIDFTF